MKSNKLDRVRLLLFLGFSFIILFFQNCGQVKFDRDLAAIYKNSNFSLIIENGAEATNKPELLMELNLRSPEDFNEMRISIHEEMDEKQIPWTSFLKHSLYPLKDLYAADGSKDGIKYFYAEVRNSKTKVSMKTSAAIGLDTISPTVLGTNILKEGIQGRQYNKNDNVEINFQIEDKVSQNQYSSGIEPRQGFKIALSYRADCSPEIIQTLQDWASPNTTFNLKWPTSSPLEAFYVCLFAKDKAGNIGNFLSQPLTSQWKLVAGDNNQGNGASVNSSNVRFKSPAIISASPAGQIFISDRQFHVLRSFFPSSVDSSRIINLILGTGKPQSAKPGFAEESGLNGGTPALDFDSSGNAYFVSQGKIFKLYKDSERWKVSLLSNPGGALLIAVRNFNNQESLLIFRGVNLIPNDPVDATYIYEVPLSELNSSPSTLSLSTLNNQYRIAGNGIVPASSFTIPDVVTLTKNDSINPQYSVGFPSSITTGKNGEIYFATRSDGNGYGWGHHTIRKLTPIDNQGFKQEVLSRNVAWAYQLSYHKITTPANSEIEEKLSIAAHSGFYQIDLLKSENTPWSAQLKTPITPNNEKIYYGGTSVIKNNNTDVEYYLSASNFSQVLHYDRDFNLIEILGRPVFRENEPDALQAMIGQPEGIVQAPNGIIYFFDSLNHILRSVNPANHALELVVGKPQKPESKIYINENFENVKLTGLTVFYGGYNHDLTGIFNSNQSTLYLGQGSTGYLHAIDLINKKVNTIGGHERTGASSDRFAFPINGLTTMKNIDNSYSLYASRSWHLAYGLADNAPFTGFVEAFSVNGAQRTSSSQVALGDPTTNAVEYFKVGQNDHGTDGLKSVMHASKSLAIDSRQFLYRSSYDFLVTKISEANQKITRVDINGSKKPGINSFLVLEEGDKRYIVYPSGLALKFIELNVADFNKAQAISVNSSTLCLPGGFINNISGMAISNQGNILLSDQFSGQILEYFIRDVSGNIVFNICN